LKPNPTLLHNENKILGLRHTIVGFGAFISYRIIENKGDSKQTIVNQENQKRCVIWNLVLLKLLIISLSLFGFCEANEQVGNPL
jgi:hypothetical protein